MHKPLFCLLLGLLATSGAADEARVPVNPWSEPGIVLVADSDVVVAFDATSLHPRWRADPGWRIHEPVVARSQVLVGSSDGLLAYDLTDGRLLWRAARGREVFSPTVNDERAYAGSLDGTLFAVDLADGRIRWQRRMAGWAYSPALVDGVLVTAGSARRLWGLAASDGTLRWERELVQEPVFGPVAVGNGRVVLTSFDGAVTAVNALDGRVAWVVRDPTASLAPAVREGRIFLADLGGRVRARSAADGNLLWSHDFAARLSAPPRPARGLLAVATEAGEVALLAAHDGRLVWQGQRQGAPLGSPILNGADIVVFGDAPSGGHPLPRSWEIRAVMKGYSD